MTADNPTPKQPDSSDEWVDELIELAGKSGAIFNMQSEQEFKAAIHTHISEAEAAADIAGRIDELIDINRLGLSYKVGLHIEERIDELRSRQSAEGSE